MTVILITCFFIYLYCFFGIHVFSPYDMAQSCSFKGFIIDEVNINYIKLTVNLLVMCNV